MHKSTTATRPPLLTASLIAAPVLFLVGQALLPAMPMEWSRAFPEMVEHRDQLMASRLLSAAGAFLFVPAAVALAGLLPNGSTGSRFLRVGVWMVAIGSFFNAVSQVVAGYATYAATRADIDPAVGEAMIKRLDAGLVGLPIAFWSIPVFSLGFVVIAVALLRSHLTALWIPLTLILGTILAAAFAGTGPTVALTQAPITIAIVALGLRHASPDSEFGHAGSPAHAQ